MKEKLFKKGITRRLFSVVLALAMVCTLLPMNTLTVKAASYEGPTTVNGVSITVTGNSWTKSGDWWQCCDKMRLFLNPNATSDNLYAKDAGGVYITITNESVETHSCDTCGATVSWGASTTYLGPTTVNGVPITVTGDSWTKSGDWWQCCDKMRLFLNPNATSDNLYAKDAGGVYITITNENGGTHSCDTCGATVSWGVSNTSYTITFDLNGHGMIAPTTITDVNSGDTILEPTEPTAEGYTFGGWYKEAECTNKWDFASDTVTADTTLYAKWISGGGTPLSGEHVTVDTTTQYKNLYRQAPIYILGTVVDPEGMNCSLYYNIKIAVTGDCKITGIEATVGWGTVGVGELTVNGVNIGNTTSASVGESVIISDLDATSVILGRTSTSLAQFSSFKVYYETTSGRPGITYSSGRIDYTSNRDLGWTGAGGGYTPWLVGDVIDNVEFITGEGSLYWNGVAQDPNSTMITGKIVKIDGDKMYVCTADDHEAKKAANDLCPTCDPDADSEGYVPNYNASNVSIQYKKVSDDKYTIRIVYEIDQNLIKEIDELGINASTLDGSKEQNYSGIYVFEKVLANNVEKFPGSDKYFAVCELTDVRATDEFNVLPITVKDGTVTKLAPTPYSVNMADVISTH